MFVFYSNRLGCLGSVVISAVPVGAVDSGDEELFWDEFLSGARHA